MNEPVYPDYNATTPVAPEVADAMYPLLPPWAGQALIGPWKLLHA